MELAIPYKKRNIIKWSVHTSEVFEDLKKAVQQVQTLFFFDDTLSDYEVILRTDASDKGTGGIKAQQYTSPSGQRLEKPIKLYSRAFRGAEL